MPRPTCPAACASSLAALLTIAPLAAQTEPSPIPLPTTAVRLGVFFWHDSPNDLQAFAGVESGLKTAGIACEFVRRSAESDVQRGVQALAELRAADCKLTFALGTQAALLAAKSHTDRPVVFVAVANPVASGLVADWQGSHRNLAGASYWIPPANVLATFRLALPELRRLGVLRSQASGVVSRAEFDAMREHGKQVDLELVEAVASDAADVGRATAALRGAGVQAIWIPNDLTIYSNLERVRHELRDTTIPLVATSQQAARTDAIVGATVDFALHGRRAAALALKVLRGADPGTLPIDTMQSVVVIANLDAARRSRCELPLSLLALADELVAVQSEVRR